MRGNCVAVTRRSSTTQRSGKQARELFDDAQELLERIAAKDLLIPRGAYAFWPANAVGDDVMSTLMTAVRMQSPLFIFCVSKCKSRRDNLIIVSQD
jgi:5-methyltetrahydrofolate--homocysteine methyltransferase